MLDGPVPAGARSVSWPWYHHELGEELTTEAKEVLEQYSNVAADKIESHIYRIVSSPARQGCTDVLTVVPSARQSLGRLPVAMRGRILVSFLWSVSASSLFYHDPTTAQGRSKPFRYRLVLRSRPPEMCLRRRATREPIRQRPLP